jgi:3-oxoacyl-[acyl-carrier-protein] synthase II
VVSPLGHDAPTLLHRLAAGESALAPLTDPDFAPFPCQIGAPVTGFRAADWVTNRKNLKLMSPAVQFGIAAVKRAWRAAGLDSTPLDPERVGLFVGAGTALGNATDLVDALSRGFAGGERFDLVAFARDGVPRINPLWLLKGLSNNVLGFASADLDARGVNQNYCNSAAGGLQAIGEAAWSIAEGLADVVVAGGADSGLDAAHLAGFTRLDMLTTQVGARAVNPFDASHSGFALGEGAMFFVLESEAHARARGAAVLGRLVGYGSACAARALPKCDAAAIAAAGARALELAGWSAADVDVVYAHGNATPAFDAAEAEGLTQLFGAHRPPVTSNKGQLGHTIAASGPLSAACAVQGFADDLVPGLAHLHAVAAECAELNLSAGTHHRATRRALVHAAGLGGQTTFLALESVK